VAQAKSRVKYNKVSDRSMAYAQVEQKITSDYLRQFQIRVEIEHQKDKVISAKGMGVVLAINFLEDAVEILLELPFIYSAFKNKILSKIEEELKSVL